MLVYQRARKEADSIRAIRSIGKHGLDDLVQIASRLDATVTVTPLKAGLSGFVIKDAYSPPRIYINSDEPLLRQRFTLAHEIGHLVDRSVVAQDPDYSFVDERGGKYDLHEFFADEFAGALLMPQVEIDRKIEDNKSIYAMADEFGVSTRALQKRLQRLAENPE